jgi:hypothetical protein
MSKLDGLDRKTLLGMWEEEEQAISRIMRELSGRNEEDHKFTCITGTGESMLVP